MHNKTQIGLLFKLSIDDIQSHIDILHRLDTDRKCDFHILHSSTQPEQTDPANIPSHIDIILCFGGDGTMLRSVKYSLHYNAPVLGINLGLVGFLTDITEDQLQRSFSRILDGKYKIEQKMLLLVGIPSDASAQHIQYFTALNDVAIVKSEDTKISNIVLSAGRQTVYETRCDGIVLSSSTGSTGYSLAGGGPIISEKLPAIVTTPLNAHALTLRPIVFSENETLIVTHHDYKPVSIMVDGIKVAELERTQSVVVKKATETVQFMKISTTTYFQKLQKKLKMGL